MILKTEAICIKNTRFGESGIISKLYTKDRGISSFLIQGINRKSSIIKNSHIMPGNLLEIVYYKKTSLGISRIKETKLTDNFYGLETNISKNAVLQFVLEIISKTNEDEIEDESLFNFLQKSLRFLNNKETQIKYFPLIFLCKYLSFTGWYPNIDDAKDECYFNLKEGKFIQKTDLSEKLILNSNISKKLYDVLTISSRMNYSDINIDLNQKEILQYLITYFEIHLLKGKKIKSPEILSEILN
ncbi:MAG: DNA repair protein RecO [Bacteroidia bacterium]|nr:DNA repair protein RecO [Bacteroidia bacterium]